MEKVMQHRLMRIGAGIIIYIAMIIAEGYIRFNEYVELGIFFVAYILISYDIIRKIGEHLKEHIFLDENVLIVAATVGAFGISKYIEAVLVMLFFQAGDLCEKFAMERSKKMIADTLDIRPVYAIRKVKGQEVQVEPSELKRNHVIIIKPGERVPVDAIVTKGATTLDTQALTGEYMPREAKKGDKIYSGCINLTGVIEARVAKVYSESTVSKIMDMVEAANEKKADSEEFITQFARVYTPVVVMCAVLIIVGPPLFAGMDWETWIYRGLIFLIAACPCALVLSMPVVFYGGIGAAARQGILIKSGESMEMLTKADTFIFDKTGTLTKGVFTVQEIHPIGMKEDELLEIAAHVESYSNHPIAISLQEAYKDSVEQKRVKRIKEISGCGISATFDSKKVYAGNYRLMKRQEIECNPVDTDGTVVYIAVENTYAGYIVIADSLKKEAKPTMHYLRERMQAILVMLTGDTKAASESIGRELDLDYVYTGLLADEKVSYIEEILEGQGENEKLVFVGDGINDAPVLARADVGIAMGALGSDAAIEAADIVLMEDELSKITNAIRIARETLRVSRENIWFAIAMKFFVLGLATMGLLGMWQAICADVGVIILAIVNAVWVVKYPG